MVNSVKNVSFSQFINNSDFKLSNKKFQKNVQSSSLEKLESGTQPKYNTTSINTIFQDQGNKIQFENVDNETIIKIIDSETGEIINQIPPEELLKTQSKLEELQSQFIDVYV